MVYKIANKTVFEAIANAKSTRWYGVPKVKYVTLITDKLPEFCVIPSKTNVLVSSYSLVGFELSVLPTYLPAKPVKLTVLCS